MVLQQNSIL